MTNRPPAVAGQFYPAGPAQLQHTVAALLQATETNAGKPPKAMIVPHAGYRYSGAVAASAYRRLAPARHRIRRVVLIGPAHHVFVPAMAVPAADTFQTPLGSIPVDRDAIAAITGLPGVCVSDAAHAPEHSLEVQLPFLQETLDAFALVPILVGHSEPERVAAVIDTLWGGPETLIVVSSDLSHFHIYDEARRHDRATCQHILARATTLNGDDACGAHAINGLMQSRSARALTIEALDFCNSGDTSGETDRVVGYAAFLLY